MKLKVGEVLRKKREEKCLNYDDVSRQTRIHRKYIEAIEKEDYSVFSSEVHAKGFLTSYAEFLGINIDTVLPFFRRDYVGRKTKVAPAVKPLSTPRFVFTPARVVTAGTIIIMVLFFSYLYIQYRAFAGAPLLIIDQPSGDELSIKTSSIIISGRADQDAEVTVNGQQILLREDGSFSSSISLSDGLNTLSVVARNKLGKVTTSTKRISVTLEETSPVVPPIVPKQFNGIDLEVSIGPEAAQIEIYVDGSKSFEGLVGSGVIKVFSGTSEVKVVTGNAGSTSVKVNGKDEGVLGEAGVSLEKTFKAPELPKAPGISGQSIPPAPDVEGIIIDESGITSESDSGGSNDEEEQP